MTPRAALPTVLVAAGTLLAGLAAGALARPGAAREDPPHAFEPVAEIAPAFPVASWRLLDLDGRTALLFVGRAGEVATWSWSDEAKALVRVEAPPLTLADPAHTLLALGDLLGRGTPQLVVVSPAGARAHPRLDSGAFDPEGVGLSGRARFRLRTGRPTFAPLVDDVNSDGRPDLVLPGAEACELWLGEEPSEQGGPRVRRAATVAVRVESDAEREDRALSDVLSGSFRIPSLHTQDVNGDGRADLLVHQDQIRAFHLQAEDGSFPLEPDVRVDLSIFRDTSADAGVRPGEILGGNERAQYQSRDLDGDGIPDAVIVHRRKLWVFHGTKRGPQFTETSQVLKVADDVTAATLLSLDGDRYPDLLLLKVEIPTIAALVMGFLREWDVTLRAVGYASKQGRGFEDQPRWKREMTLQLPPILDLVRDPEQIIERISSLQREFADPVEGDWNGDGRTDLVLVRGEAPRAELWLTREGDRDRAWEPDPEGRIKEVLFEQEQTRWDLDQVLASIADVAAARFSELTASRDPDARLELSGGEEQPAPALQAADLDGDGRDELLVVRESADAPGRIAIEVLRLR